MLPEVTITDDTSGADAEDDIDTLKLENYFPIQADTQYIYEGKGNEYAAYTVFTDFLDSVNNKVQTRTNNGGTETVRVIEVKDGKVSVLYMINECYYRDNLLEATPMEEPEILLQEPLVAGTQWTLPGGKQRFISAVDVSVETPSGTYKAIEVTTQSDDSVIKDYYAPQVGLVKSIFASGDMEVISTLKEVKTNTPFTQTIDVFYPDTDEKLHRGTLSLSFRTNDETRVLLESALRQEAQKEGYLPLVGENTVINSLYKGEDNIVHVDFSGDMTEDMNLGAGFETLVLQSITNTLGNYYGVEEVIITVDGKPYESGHILMKEGETFTVNMDLVVEE